MYTKDQLLTNLKSLPGLASVLLLVAFPLFLTGFASNRWIFVVLEVAEIKEKYFFFGLWKLCVRLPVPDAEDTAFKDDELCFFVTKNQPPGWFLATRAMMIISLLSSVISLLLSTAFFLVNRTRTILAVCSGFVLSAAVTALLAAIIFGANFNRDILDEDVVFRQIKYGVSFILLLISGIMFVAVFVLMAVDVYANRQEAAVASGQGEGQEACISCVTAVLRNFLTKFHWKRPRCLAWLCCVLGTVLFIAGYASPKWLVVKRVGDRGSWFTAEYYGLWRVCGLFDGRCISTRNVHKYPLLGSTEPLVEYDEFVPTKATATLALISTLAACCLITTYIFTKTHRYVLVGSMVSNGLAALFSLISISIFAAKTQDLSDAIAGELGRRSNLGPSYGLVVISLLLMVAVLVLLIVELMPTKVGADSGTSVVVYDNTVHGGVEAGPKQAGGGEGAPQQTAVHQ